MTKPSCLKTVVIRKAKEDDLIQLSKVAKRTFKNTFNTMYTVESMLVLLHEHFTEEALRPFVSDIFLAIEKDTIIGYYQKQDMEEPVCHFTGITKSLLLKRFYVEKEYFGLGLAQMMMTHFLALRAGRLCWLTVFGGNLRAIAFYEKCGFVQKEGEEILWSNHILLDGSRDVDQIYFLQGE